MVRIAICDDETKILDNVSSYISKFAEKRSNQQIEISHFNSAKDLDIVLDAHSFDIFILDVYIGKELGTDLAKNIRKRGIESPIIFLTTSVEHAPQGYETGTLRYLIKPIESIKVRATVSELYTTLAKKGGFVRLGSAYIINLRNIKNLSSNEVLLYNNTTISIPRGKYAELKKAFWDYQCE